ncbi:hypothetical protein [Texcoconibacillus texcoconensis]|uniref:Uncharacterized protein n=1 Tax=Texcoconibacillus texcoconensis TaxID=1095777 RepID=A0A840QML6_9BACI|nr:hypothetical protein [Texcoconibacillus texcoconensis]MBB5172625.1 hypothetical protein [Texcoconibacillus texcoconensis]
MDMSENFTYLSTRGLKSSAKYIFIVYLLLTIVVLSMFHPLNAFANGEEDVDNDTIQTVLFLVPSFSFQELDALVSQEKSDSIWQKGGTVAVNTRPDGEYSYLNSMVSLSSGSLAVGVKGWNGFQQDELIENQRASHVYQQWTGRSPTKPLIHPHIDALMGKNAATNYRAPVGELGERLQTSGVNTAVTGHSDTSEEEIRYGSLFIVDKNGEAEGSFDGTVDNDAVHASFGQQMNEDLVMEWLNEQISQANDEGTDGLYVIEWGDFHRLFEQKADMNDSHFEQRLVDEEERLVSILSRLIDTDHLRVLFLSPMMHGEAYQNGEQLAPLWYWGEARDEVLSIYSSTTRRDDLVSNRDIAATLYDWYDVAPPEMVTGKPLSTEAVSTINYEVMKEDREHMFTVFKERGSVLSLYISVLVVSLIAVRILMWLRPRSIFWQRLMTYMLAAASSSPFWFLVTGPIVSHVSMMVYFILILLVSLLTSWLVVTFTKHPVISVCFLSFLALTIDLLIGGVLIRQSFLGYDPIIGARYYGIGNELAGVFIVSGWFMLFPILQREGAKLSKTLIVGVTLTTQVILLAASPFGANAGASLSAAVMSTYILYRFTNRDKKPQLLIVSSVLFIGAFFLLYLLNTMTSSSTHVSEAFHRLFSGDFASIFDIIKRKLAVNVRIFQYSHWTQLFVTTYVLIGWSVWKQRKQKNDHLQTRMIQAAIVASIALLFLNDSGVVAASTSMFITLNVHYVWKLRVDIEETGVIKNTTS